MTPELVLLKDILICWGEGDSDDCDVSVSLEFWGGVSTSWSSSTEPVFLKESCCGEGGDDCDVSVSLEFWGDVSTSWFSSVASTISIKLDFLASCCREPSKIGSNTTCLPSGIMSSTITGTSRSWARGLLYSLTASSSTSFTSTTCLGFESPLNIGRY